MLCRHDPEIGLAQVGLDLAALREQHRGIALRVEMVLSSRDPVQADIPVDIGICADAPLELEGKLEDGAHTAFPGGGIVMKMRQCGARWHVRAAISGVEKAEPIMRNRIVVVGMRFPDGDRVAEAAFAGRGDPVADRCLLRVFCGPVRRGGRRQKRLQHQGERG